MDILQWFRLLLLLFLISLICGASIQSSKAIRKQIGQNGCIITLPANRNFAPIITDQKTSETLIPVLSDIKGNGPSYLNIEPDRQIKVSCGRGNPLTEFDPYYYLLLSCVKGNEFLNQRDEQIFLREGVECSDRVKASASVIRNGTCSGKGTNFDVKFVTESPPRTYYSVCVDEAISGTLYSTSYLDGGSFANGSSESSGNRPDFRGHEFYPFSIKQAYKWENAFEHLSDLLGSSELVDEYFPSQQHRFSRGHLFPNADGIKRFEKHATFYYINTVPQWQLLNGGNWAIVEQDVRDLAASLRRTFKVVTGSFGVTTLKDVNGNDVELYLARDVRGKLRLPVPRLVWKVIHDPVGSSAVAIVQINNPWFKPNDNSPGNYLCNDVCGSLPWLRSDGFYAARKGFTYCCDLKELSKSIPYLPKVEYKNLLGVGYVSNNNGNNSNQGSEEDEYGDEDDDEEDEEEDEEEDDESGSSDSDSSDSDEDSNAKYDGNHNPHDIKKLFRRVKLS